MPATEQTWWNLKLLHVVFAATAVALLVATVFVLTGDHNRPWKQYAREFRELETWNAQARIDEQDSKSYEARRDELEVALGDARRADLDGDVARAFITQVRTVTEDAQAADRAELDIDQLKSQQDPEQRLVVRGDLLARLRDIVKRTKFREDNLAGALKLRRAELDKNRADYELAVAEEAPADRQASLLVLADSKRQEVAAASLAFQDANTHRKKLDALLGQMTKGEDDAAKALADHRAKLVQLQKTLATRESNAGKSLLELPVLEAFNSPIRVDQIWLPQLTLNNNFRDVARFDRCTTCHRGMDKSMAGAPTEPGYPEAETMTVALATPAAKPAAPAGDGNDGLEASYGLRLAAHGLFASDDPTVSVVVPESPAAVAGLQSGDVIEAVDGGKTLARKMAVTSLLDTPVWGKPLSLTVRRGVPQPYSSHPRLDLFVGDSSPHPMKNFGCTICHQGQGSATSFKWSSHTPNTPKQAHEWHDEHGWFNNHHWIQPMLPARFEESSCLKCHHQVVDLEPSEKFPEPPAPKLVEGYHLIRQYGCYGCHEINGWAGPEKRIGPDMRLESNYHEVAEALATDPGLKDMGETVARWVTDVRSGPDSHESRVRLREPSRYHPKTIMPNVLLEPVTLADGSVSDPAADATEYLMGSGRDWKPAADWQVETLDGETSFPMASAGSLSAEERKALDELALMYLKERFTVVRAEQVLAAGVGDAAAIQGDERMLVGLDGAERDRLLLTYVGKKTINKLACYSCHDIPGFEDSKPAGAALADWGRKDPSRIAFEQVSHLVTRQLAGGHGHGHHATGSHGQHGGGEPAAEDGTLAPDLAYEATHAEAHVDPESLDPSIGYFLEKLLGHEREGFLWQKLRAPRSYDYKKAENKTYNERYRMPQFPFNEAQRESVMTFVLGLVAEPPAPQYVHQPAPREQARLDGLVVAEQYNCGGCHQLRMDRWDIRYKPESLGEPSAFADYPFLSPHFTPDQVAASLATDRQGRRKAILIGMPTLDPETGKPQLVDEDGVPIEEGDAESVVHRPFALWQDALVDGAPRTVGGQNLIVPQDAIAAGHHYPGWGGDLAKLLFPVVIADEKQVNPNVKPDDAWGWLPPPLVGEGKKVQSAWLHKFLLNPHPIRPPAVLRMPKFNFDSAKAAALVNYFASVDGAEYPYVYDPRLDESSVAAAEQAHPGHLDGALKIVTNNNYCVKCHLVGDYTPAGSVKALAPQLQRVHERLRPDYVHGWIANPKRFLPYTGMPVNIPYNQPVSQDLYQGTSEQQVDALTDLLMHFDAFAKRNMSLEAFLRQQPPAAPAGQPAPSQPAAGQPRAASGPASAAESAPLSSTGSPSASASLN